MNNINIERAANRAHMIFKREGWGYGLDKAPPTESDLRRTIAHLLKSLDEPEVKWSETGRFFVIRDEGEGLNETKVCLVLADSWDTDE